MRVLILGASGFIGQRLAATLRGHGIAVLTASLRKPLDAARLANGCTAVVNLAGESVAQRWTPKAKQAIRDSRTSLPREFLAAVAKLQEPPKHYITASAVGYYGTSLTEEFDEKSQPGHDFLADVCQAWEHEAGAALEYGMALTIIRTGLVCGSDGGALPKLLPIFRLGLGGIVGTGEQWYSWIHIDDVVGIYLHALDGVEGILNATAPTPVRNAEFTEALAMAVGKKAGIPVPAFAIKLQLGEGATIALDGQRVLPTRTLETGYMFRHPDLDEALVSVVRSR